MECLDFGIVGVLNTVIDFALLNILSIGFGLPRIPSNIVSTTVAMIFSFTANKRLVFESKSDRYVKEVTSFFVVTIFGLYVIQSAIIYLFVDVSSVPGDIAISIAEFLRLDAIMSDEFIITNTAKLLATIATMVWNYFLYKNVVFADRKSKEPKKTQ